MNPQQEKRAYWQKWIEEHAASGLSRREFCQQNNLVLSQFTYYYLEFKKKEQRELQVNSDVIPIKLRKTSSIPLQEIKVVLPNGLQLLIPCTEGNQLKEWVEVLKSC